MPSGWLIDYQMYSVIFPDNANKENEVGFFYSLSVEGFFHALRQVNILSTSIKIIKLAKLR